MVVGPRDERLTLDAKEVATLLGVGVDTVYEGAKTGEVPGSVRVGRRLLFSKAAILRWIGTAE